MLIIAGCGSKTNGETASPGQKKQETATVIPKGPSEKAQKEKTGYKATFIELGSVNCIPCKKMQPVMREIEEKYPDVNVIFYDVWRPEGRPFAQTYRIRVIPTQVFLDENGKEYFRHEGFFPREEVEKVLAKAGVEIKGGISQ
ncbi:thioredoxin family protein [bacterium]|nr:thioredoxin family protein [bacterium]